MLDNFVENTTVEFDVEITHNGVAPDITGDTVTLLVKEKKTDTDAEAKINKAADVAAAGASGVARFTLTKTDTKITPKIYFFYIRWDLAGGKRYPCDRGKVEVEDSIKDVD